MTNHRETLLQLCYVRAFILFGLCLSVIYIIYGLKADLQINMVGATLGIMALINLVTCARLFSHWPVTETEFFTQLTADVSLYGALLFYMGGATNPFIFLLLIPLVIASTILSKGYVWFISIIVITVYSSLLTTYYPLINFSNSHQHRIIELFDIQIIAMWINFLLTALVVTYFIVGMRQSIQMRQDKLEQQRERCLQDQQLLSLATMAAGTAHELGTPLSTIQVVLSEIKYQYADRPDLLENLNLIQQQTEICAQGLKKMTQSVQQEQASTKILPAPEIIAQVVEQQKIQRPTVTCNINLIGIGSPPKLNCSTSLKQSILNLLNNAADASPKDINIEIDWDQQTVFFRIHDQGPGISLEQSDNLGKPFITTKGKGLGIGLFLTTTTLARYEGDVRLYNHPKGGTLTEVTLPIKGKQ